MYVGVGVCLCWEYDYRLLVVFNLRFLSMTRVRYLIAIKYICCMHVCMGIRGMYHHCSRSLVMLSMWMLLHVPIVRIVNVTYIPGFSSMSTRGWYF